VVFSSGLNRASPKERGFSKNPFESLFSSGDPAPPRRGASFREETHALFLDPCRYFRRCLSKACCLIFQENPVNSLLFMHFCHTASCAGFLLFSPFLREPRGRCKDSIRRPIRRVLQTETPLRVYFCRNRRKRRICAFPPLSKDAQLPREEFGSWRHYF